MFTSKFRVKTKRSHFCIQVKVIVDRSVKNANIVGFFLSIFPQLQSRLYCFLKIFLAGNGKGMVV
jgi:hypothetical protein